MKVFDLSFTDGKSCRCIVLEESADDPEEERQLRNNFHPGYVATVARVMPPPPTKIPWKRQHKTMWTCGLFALSKLDSGDFHCFWPGGEVTGDKAAVSKAVRENWNLGLLT